MSGDDDGWVDAWMGGWMVVWMDVWMDGWMNESMDGWMEDIWMDMWMDGWMDGWMNRWMEGWMGGRMSKCFHKEVKKASHEMWYKGGKREDWRKKCVVIRLLKTLSAQQSEEWMQLYYLCRHFIPEHDTLRCFQTFVCLFVGLFFFVFFQNIFSIFSDSRA